MTLFAIVWGMASILGLKFVLNAIVIVRLGGYLILGLVGRR